MPVLRDAVGEGGHGAPRLGVEVMAGPGEEPGGVEDPPCDQKAELTREQRAHAEREHAERQA